MVQKILLCGPIREEPEIFEMYLESLRNQKIDEKWFQVDRLFIFHNCEWLSSYLIKDEKYFAVNDESVYVKTERTHNWTEENFSSVVKIKNSLIEYAVMYGYDYIFFVDSDLILHPNTLDTLLKANKDIVAEVFWTIWNGDLQNAEPLPNAWRYDSYIQVVEEVNQWRNTKGLYRVGMTGACTLIKRRVLEKEVTFTPINNVSFTAWEDRAFCIRASVNGFEIWLDTHYPAFHIYRNSLIEEGKQFLERVKTDAEN